MPPAILGTLCFNNGVQDNNCSWIPGGRLHVSDVERQLSLGISSGDGSHVPLWPPRASLNLHFLMTSSRSFSPISVAVAECYRPSATKVYLVTSPGG